MIDILKSLTPSYLFTLSLSGRYDEYEAMLQAKKAFSPFVKATKFTAHAQYHVTGAKGSSKTTRNNFWTPNCLFTIPLLLGYHGSYIKAAVLGHKSPVKNGPQNGGFQKFKDLKSEHQI